MRSVIAWLLVFRNHCCGKVRPKRVFGALQFALIAVMVSRGGQHALLWPNHLSFGWRKRAGSPERWCLCLPRDFDMQELLSVKTTTECVRRNGCGLSKGWNEDKYGLKNPFESLFLVTNVTISSCRVLSLKKKQIERGYAHMGARLLNTLKQCWHHFHNPSRACVWVSVKCEPNVTRRQG